MYEEFFGLQRRPFCATPDASCFVPLEGAQGVLDALAVSCERGQGISVLTGETGLGKTLIGLRLAFELQPTFATAFLNHSAFPTRRALLQAILFELNRPYNRMAEQELRLELMAALKTLRPQHQALVVILDEAHRLSLPVLDEVRLLTMMADNGVPLARVVLIGNRDLEERLADPELSEFNQRICCQVDLEPLTQADSIEYLRTSLEIAGADPEDIFAPDVLPFIAKAADGSPRCLNHLADHCLLLAFVSEQKPVTADVARDALNDLKQLPLHWNDPVGGGEIYRGLSNTPTREDSAVDLWPQAEPHHTNDEPSEPADDAWETASLGEGSAAIEIGGETSDFESSPSECHETESTADITCLKDDWHVTSPRSQSIDDVLADVDALTDSVAFESDASAADTLSGSPYFGQVFGSRALEFGAPSPDTFAVDEFVVAGDDGEASAYDEVEEEHGSDLRRFAIEDFAEVNSLRIDEQQQAVWNLPVNSWEASDSMEFEEEPVIDRYVRIESGAQNAGIVWNFNAPHGSSSAKRTPVVAVQQQADAFAEDDSPDLEQSSAEEFSHDFSGIVESYSRLTREPNRGRSDDSADSQDSSIDDATLPPPQIERHLPSELLRATCEDDGLEEQIGADVLDLYLETQQMVNRIGRTAMPTISLDEPAEERPRPFDVVQPEPARDESESRGPDVIQRAYGRLFSELRRKRR